MSKEQITLQIGLRLDVDDGVDVTEILKQFVSDLKCDFEDTTGQVEIENVDITQFLHNKKWILPCITITAENVAKLKNRTSDYLCRECAKKCGGKHVYGHLATYHDGKCGVCGEDKSLANVGDWDWPDNKHRGMRD